MVAVLAVPDGAAEPVGPGPTCLEAAVTPTLDGLATRGVPQRVRTIPDGLPAGTEVGLPTLLGVHLAAPPPRGRIEAAAAGVALCAGEEAWRLDLVPHRTPDRAEVVAVDAAVTPLGGRVVALRGHRLLLLGPAAWGDGPPGPHQTDQPLAAVATGAFADVAEAAAAVVPGGVAWPWGTVAAEGPGQAARSRAAREDRTPTGPRRRDGGWPDVPATLGCPVTVVTRGAPVAGIARLLGCGVADADPARVVADAADEALVVVHDAGPDEAGHAHDRAGKITAIERFDATLRPVVDVVGEHGGALAVSPDHGCDPATGRHGAEPVPAVVWSPTAALPRASSPRITERDLAGHDAHPARVLLAALRAAASGAPMTEAAGASPGAWVA